MRTSSDHYLDIIQGLKTLEELQETKHLWFGKSGKITEAVKALGKLSLEEKKRQGEFLHHLKKTTLAALEHKEQTLKAEILNQKLLQERVDVGMPGAPVCFGFEHPVMQVFYDSVGIFQEMGFEWVEGPEIEDEFYNFDALNVTEGHPARAEQDTFYLPHGLLRTQTSSVQIRTMQSKKPPLKVVSPGRVYRSDCDQTHTPMFHQIEGLVISERASMAELKGVLQIFLEKFFQRSVQLRFRPSFFPFTEPSCEVDIGYRIENDAIVLGEGDKWLEILGCGMVNPQVLINCDISPEEHQGYAFGMGLERLAMLRYGVQDLREFYRNDQRWLSNLRLHTLSGHSV